MPITIIRELKKSLDGILGYIPTQGYPRIVTSRCLEIIYDRC